MSVQQWWKGTDGGTPKFSNENLTQCHLSTINPTWTGPILTRASAVKRSPTDYLKHGTAFFNYHRCDQRFQFSDKYRLLSYMLRKERGYILSYKFNKDTNVTKIAVLSTAVILLIKKVKESILQRLYYISVENKRTNTQIL
jgi:hypothetical protein